GHRLLDDEDLGGAGAERRVLHRALLDLRDARRHRDDDPRPDEEGPAVRLLDEMIEHLLRDLEVGDDAVLHRPDRDDVAGRAAQHFLGVGADGLDAVGRRVDGDDRRLAHDDAFAAREDERVRRAEVDREVVRKDRENGFPGQREPPPPESRYRDSTNTLTRRTVSLPEASTDLTT